MKIVEKVKNKSIGEYYAFRNPGTKNPFKNPMAVCYSLPLVQTDIVADIGAYIGEYSRWAALQGVKKVLSYEATPETFEILQKNTITPMDPKNIAITGEKRDRIVLYISHGIGVTNSIVKKKRKSHKISVPALQYEEAIQEATVVKIDVEGAEYSYHILQPQVRAYIIEFHPLVSFDWRTRALRIIQNLKESGFSPIKEPGFKHGWDFIGAWRR